MIDLLLLYIFHIFKNFCQNNFNIFKKSRIEISKLRRKISMFLESLVSYLVFCLFVKFQGFAYLEYCQLVKIFERKNVDFF